MSQSLCSCRNESDKIFRHPPLIISLAAVTIRHMSSCPPGSCAKRTRLLLEYEEAIQTYSAAVADLARLSGRITLNDYQRLFRTTQRALQLSEDASGRLEIHAAKHNCLAARFSGQLRSAS
jgi:hypothetical protein